MSEEEKKLSNKIAGRMAADDRTLIREYLDSGFDLNSPVDETGLRLIHLAAGFGTPGMVDELIEAGADKNLEVDMGTILHVIMPCEGRAGMIDHLIDDLGLDIEARNSNNLTPLALSVENANLENFELLCKKGANLAAGELAGQTVLEKVVELGDENWAEVCDKYLANLRPEEDFNRFLQPALDAARDKTSIHWLHDDLRKQISRFGRKKRPLKLLNMGKKIEIESIIYRPIYINKLISLYEHRQTVHGCGPWDHRETVERTLFEPADAAPWDYRLNEPEGFECFNQKYILPDSVDIVECGTCGGKGRHSCPDCGGRGESVCSACDGAGTKKCPVCSGRGKISCSKCGGRGEVIEKKIHWEYDSQGKGYQVLQDEKVRCSHCGGSGKRTCPECGGKQELTCRSCYGTGKITCSSCAGKGEVSCSICGGTGRMMNYLEIRQEIAKSDRWHEVCPALVFEWDDEGLRLNYEKMDPKIIWSVTDSFIPEDYLDNGDFRSGLHELSRESLTLHPFQNKSTPPNINRQELLIMRFEGYEVDYGYKGKKYKIFVYGDGDKFRCIEHPEKAL